MIFVPMYPEPPEDLCIKFDNDLPDGRPYNVQAAVTSSFILHIKTDKMLLVNTDPSKVKRICRVYMNGQQYRFEDSISDRAAHDKASLLAFARNCIDITSNYPPNKKLWHTHHQM